MGKSNLIFIGIIIGIVLVSGCSSKYKNSTYSSSEKEKAIISCVQLCKSYLANGTDLANGPCISNKIENDWVCDIAHSPRLPIDNDPKNQCSSYISGGCHHFVELTPSCELIRAI